MLAATLLLACTALTGQTTGEPRFIALPGAFKTLVNPACSHCVDESKRRLKDLKADDPVLAWTRGYSDGGAIPIRFFLNNYRVISDSYGVFVNDPDAGYARGFAPSYEFTFHGWRNGVMVMKHADGTLYSCLSGEAFAGPKKGTRLHGVPTLVSNWGFWLEKYPGAVAYHMFDKYQPTELAAKENSQGAKTRGKLDPRLNESALVLGVWSGKNARAYPLHVLEKAGLIKDTIAGAALVVLWEPRTKSAAAYRPLASPPRKFKAPAPNEQGISPPDEGVLLVSHVPPRSIPLTFAMSSKPEIGPFIDTETKSYWDIAGRCVQGELKGWTLEWIDSVQAKWFAWSAESPHTELYVGKMTQGAFNSPLRKAPVATISPFPACAS